MNGLISHELHFAKCWNIEKLDTVRLSLVLYLFHCARRTKRPTTEMHNLKTRPENTWSRHFRRV